MAVNNHLYQVQDGDKETPFYLSFQNYSPPAAGSGRTDPGNYALDIRKCFWRRKKAGSTNPGLNLVLEMMIAGPDGCAGVGVPITVYQPQPQVSDDPAKDMDCAKAQNLLVSILSGMGQADEALKTPGDLKFNPAWFEGKRVFARVRYGKGDYANRSEVHFWMRMEEYDANPGPDTSVTPQASSAQTSTPEVGIGVSAPSGNGSTQTAPATGGTSAAGLRSVLGV